MTPSLAWRPIYFGGHRPSKLGSLHGLLGPYGNFQSVGLDKPIGSSPYTWCHVEVDPLGSPKTPVEPGDPLSLAATGPRNWVLYMVLAIHMVIFRMLGWTNLMGLPPYT